jgi:phosphoglucosamine mutase
MSANGCRLGGEQSGHIIFSKYATTGDGILTSLKIMEVMLAGKKKASELCAGFTFYPQLLRNFRVADKKAAMTDADVLAAVDKANASLGDSGRVLLRASGTEPVIRLMLEAESEAVCEQYAEDIIAVLRSKNLI